MGSLFSHKNSTAKSVLTVTAFFYVLATAGDPFMASSAFRPFLYDFCMLEVIDSAYIDSPVIFLIAGSTI